MAAQRLRPLTTKLAFPSSQLGNEGQILIGHMMAIAGEANQIFRPVTMFDHGIDGEVEFKDNDGKASGKRIYRQGILVSSGIQ